MPTPTINAAQVYTLSGNHGEYESDKWNGIVDNNNSTIKVNWFLSLSGSGKTFDFTGDKSGTYQFYNLNSPNNVDLDTYESTFDSSIATLTYWATTDYGGTKFTGYFYYKLKAPQYEYRLYIKVNSVVMIGDGLTVGGGSGSTISIFFQGKQINGKTWYSMGGEWKLKEDINVSFTISNAKLNSDSYYQSQVNGTFIIHSGYPLSHTDDNKSINYKGILNPVITEYYSWDASPTSIINHNPSTVYIEYDGKTHTINTVYDSSSKSGSTSSGGGFQPGGGTLRPGGFETVQP